MTPDPSAEEIAAACEIIQSNWSPLERRARRLWVPTAMVRRGRDDSDDMTRPLEVQLVRPNMADLPAEYELPSYHGRMLEAG